MTKHQPESLHKTQRGQTTQPYFNKFLGKFVETVRIARNCHQIILQNFWGTIVVDTIGIGLAAAGILNPLLATFIHVTSELTFILNSTRLLPPREKTNAVGREATLAHGEKLGPCGRRKTGTAILGVTPACVLGGGG